MNTQIARMLSPPLANRKAITVHVQWYCTFIMCHMFQGIWKCFPITEAWDLSVRYCWLCNYRGPLITLMDGKLFIFTGANKIPVCRCRFERVKRNLKEAGVQYRTCRDRTTEKAQRPLFDLSRGVKEIFGSDSVLILKHFFFCAIIPF